MLRVDSDCERIRQMKGKCAGTAVDEDGMCLLTVGENPEEKTVLSLSTFACPLDALSILNLVSYM